MDFSGGRKLNNRRSWISWFSELYVMSIHLQYGLCSHAQAVTITVGPFICQFIEIDQLS